MGEYRHAILEMAQLEDLFHGWHIGAGSEGGNIPHFYFYTKVSPRGNIYVDGGCIMFEDAAYFGHGPFREHLRDGVHRDLQDFLAKKTEYGGTRWQFLISLWNASGQGRRIDPKQDIPDYSEIVSYSEYKKLKKEDKKRQNIQS